MNVMDALNWRYAVRQFAPQRLDEDKVMTLLDATRLSATSYGLQPYRMIQVDDMDVRRALLEYTYGQEKVVDCSHLIVFAVQTHIGDEMVDCYIRSVAETRSLAVNDLKGLAEHMKSVFSGMTPEQKREWAHQQAYIALGTMLTVAPTMEIDTCPMGGIESDGYDAVLGLSEKGLATSVVCSLGIRHPGDENAQLKKVRYDLSEMVMAV